MVKFLELFHAAPPNHVAMFAKLFCTAYAVSILFNFNDQLRYYRTRPSGITGKPSKILKLFKTPAITETQFLFFGITLIAGLLCIAAGLLPRFFAIVALTCYFPYFNAIRSLSYIQRKTNLLPLTLLILAISPSTGEPLDSPSTSWEIMLIKIAIVQVYFSSAVQKIRQSGLAWCNGETLQAYLMDNYMHTGSKASLYIAQRKGLCTFLSIFTILFELTFGLIIFLPQLSFAYVGLALLFHTGILITMQINYLKYITPAYMVFFTDVAFWIKHKL